MKKIKDIFDRYKILKICLKDFNNKSNLDEKSFKFVSAIDSILSIMDTDYAQILMSYYIKNIPKENLHYSSSTYYFKLHKANKLFMQYMDIYNEYY